MRRLNKAEIERSDRGPSFAAVTPEMLFSKDADGALAYRVRTMNPRVYEQLKEEWRYTIGELKRPDSYYDRA